MGWRIGDADTGPERFLRDYWEHKEYCIWEDKLWWREQRNRKQRCASEGGDDDGGDYGDDDGDDADGDDHSDVLVMVAMVMMVIESTGSASLAEASPDLFLSGILPPSLLVSTNVY